jgi:RNA polymerase sigma-B factor
VAGAYFCPLQVASLEGLSDEELLARCRELPEDSGGRAAIREVLVRRYEPVVRGCIRQYRGSPESAEDLMQVGYLGLMKAINNFDPAFGRGLKAYAVPCISGEVKRHFRDKRWQVRVTRPVQELMLEMRGAAEDLTGELGRHPADAELARRLGVSEEELREARRAAENFTALSLDAPVQGLGEDPGDLGSLLGEEDAAVERAVDMEAVTRHWQELPRREQRILVLRFYGNMTQEEIAGRLGISQMHVSRLLARALTQLRDRLLNDPAASAGSAIGAT